MRLVAIISFAAVGVGVAHAAPGKRVKATFTCTLGDTALKDGGRAVLDDDITCAIQADGGGDDLAASIVFGPKRPFPDEQDVPSDAEPLDADTPLHWSITLPKGSVPRCADVTFSATIARGDDVVWTRTLHVRGGCTLPKLSPAMTCELGPDPDNPLADEHTVRCRVALGGPAVDHMVLQLEGDAPFGAASKVIPRGATDVDLGAEKAPPSRYGCDYSGCARATKPPKCTALRMRGALLLDGAILWTARVRVKGGECH